MRKIIIVNIFLILYLFGSHDVLSQACVERPEPLLFSNDTSICLGEQVVFHADVNPDYPVSIGSIGTKTLSDDMYSDIVDIGFDFVFYGNTYSQCIISSNNYISFVLGNAGTGSGWSITGPAPSTNAPELAIMAPWQDILPSSGGQIRYQTIGEAPNRIFVVEYCNIPMFSCTGILFTDQILLYEGCNIIETYIVSKDYCAWNGGQAIHGLSKNATTAHIVPGRNAPGTWTAFMDGYRFTPDPDDADNYIIEPVDYSPFLLGLDPEFISWYKGESSTTPIATGMTFSDYPTEPTTYVVEIAAGGTCNGVVKRYNIEVDFNSNFYDTTRQEICQGEVYDHYGDLYYESGMYTKHLTFENSCDTFRTLILTVHPKPDATVNTNNTSICEGDEAILTATNPGTASEFQWYKDGIPISGATHSSYAATQAGAYRIVMTSDKGCVDTSRQVTILVNPNAEVAIASEGSDFSDLCLGDTVLVSVRDPQPLYEYRWSPEKNFRYLDGFRQGAGRAVINETTYLTVKAINQYGCTAYDSILVVARPCCDIIVPTAFSPNGDGLNDYFNILLQPGQKVVSFQIFDRLGNMVYDNNQPEKGWNGHINNSGERLEQGVYFYRMVYSCTDQQNYETKGDITLVY